MFIPRLLHRISTRTLGLSLIAAGMLAACVPAPKKNYTPDEVAEISSLDEIMRVQAARMDPLFSIRDEASFTEAQFDQMKESAAVIVATARATEAKFSDGRPQGFIDHAQKLGRFAEQLDAAAEAGDAEAAGPLLSQMKDTCASCHSNFR